ncbi:magnesium transporter CorA family protein [Neiella sp. HB171785]|uniref:Magnesium transporter CorA family protein n=1 Tax=Neiella litorisoli TaxID=2771431 RepID=A0A8J6QQQ7_9GAMM|nr:magnesium transporter CorA family protein [Neiella litorisoli]MBD1388954.1 magnesium transporter CorA family protein [Neiella litorisoli]
MIRVAYFSEQSITMGDEQLIKQWQNDSGFIWIDFVREPKEQERALLAELGCHTLAIEDAQRDRRPPKVESFDHLSLVLYRGFSKTEELLDVKTMALSAFVGDRILITRRTEPSLGVEAMWQDEQLAHYVQSPALLLSKILNASAIRYTESVLEAEDEISELEDAMLTRSNDELMNRLIILKSHLRKLHRIKSYHVKLVRQILTGDINHFSMDDTEVKHSFRDVYDKFERLESLTALYYDLCGDLIEGYISLSSHQLNKTMQLLTVVSAIFVPLTFIAGIYGMNFEHIPELSFKYGYFVLWGFMAFMASALLILFRRKRWL